MKFNLIRKFWPKWYIRKGMALSEKVYKERLKGLPQKNRDNLEYEYHCEIREWEEWQTSINDTELIKRAKKAGVYLDEIPFPQIDEDDLYAIKNSHYYLGQTGDMLLDPDVRKKLTQEYRKRLPEYRKERRELWDLYVRAGGVLTGILGAVIGIIAVFHKCGVGS